MIAFILFFSFISLVLLVGQISRKNPLYDELEEEGLSLSQLTVIIPFRNESEKIGDFLDSMIRQSHLPKLIFINDHSEDDSCEIIQQYDTIPFTLLHLDEYEQGKKAAIRKGILSTSTEFILTLDADVQLSKNYFETLRNVKPADATIFPVKFSNQPYFAFFNFDYYYLFLLNAGLNFLNRPTTASGANFLFRRECYLNFIQSKQNGQTTSSGDDSYFLNYLVRNKKKVQLCYSSPLTVRTEISTSFPKILQQRIRWIKKKSSVQRLLPVLLSILGLIYHFGFIVLAYLYPEKWIELIVLKIAFDWIAFLPFLTKISVRFTPLRLIFFSFFYPIWILIILFSSLAIQPKWKGRKINA